MTVIAFTIYTHFNQQIALLTLTKFLQLKLKYTLLMEEYTALFLQYTICSYSFSTVFY